MKDCHKSPGSITRGLSERKLLFVSCEMGEMFANRIDKTRQEFIGMPFDKNAHNIRGHKGGRVFSEELGGLWLGNALLLRVLALKC